MWMPTCQAARSAAKKKACEGDDHAEHATRPVHGLSGKPRDHEQERQGESKPPEARGDGPDARQPYEPGPEREGAASKQ